MSDRTPPEALLEAIRSNLTSQPAESADPTDETFQALLGLLGRKHALTILHRFVAADEPLRFGDLEEGVSPNTLSARLDELASAGLVERTAYDEVPPRVEYELTETGAGLEPLFRYLGAWAERNDLATPE